MLAFLSSRTQKHRPYSIPRARYINCEAQIYAVYRLCISQTQILLGEMTRKYALTAPSRYLTDPIYVTVELRVVEYQGRAASTTHTAAGW
jgi:hypothetical protein